MLIAIMLAAALQATPDDGGGKPLYPAPRWMKKPTGADIARVYPAAAADQNQSGVGVMKCGVGATGRLADCKIVFEGPEGAGFGDAALKLADKFQMSEVAGDQPTEGGSVKIPIVFRMENQSAFVSTVTAKLTRSDGLKGKAEVMCRVSRATPKPEFEGCAVVSSMSEAVAAAALDYATKLQLPPRMGRGIVAVPVEFGGG
jgi:TonB family protein